MYSGHARHALQKYQKLETTAPIVECPAINESFLVRAHDCCKAFRHVVTSVYVTMATNDRCDDRSTNHDAPERERQPTGLARTS